jgi:hypothetical protein
MNESHNTRVAEFEPEASLSLSANDDGNDDGPDSPPVNIPAGDIQFFDNFMPALEDGTYHITVTQEVNEVIDSTTNTTQALTRPYVQEQYFTVHGPRFTLAASEVYSVFPPQNSLADYTGVLPHIVLNKRTLPWERTLDGLNPGSNNQPWLALLLFEAGEIIVDSPPPGAGSGSSTNAQSLPLNEVINLPLEGAILGPQNILLDPGETTSPPAGNCLVIDILPETFLAVAPQLRELPFLAHAREVNTGNKEILGIDADGWFSVVVSNRTVIGCAARNPGGAGTLNIAHLVSLEGLQAYLPDATGKNPSIPNNIERVRLVSLASWTFTCFSTGLNFRNLMQNLKVGALQLSGDASPPAFSPPAQSTPVDAQAIVQSAYQLGYVPLNYTTQQGEQTVAWCRGPLVPFATRRVERLPFANADEAKIYDPHTGMFDLSLAVAWQIGRLLALSDKEFSVALLNWQREVNSLINLLVGQTKLLEKFGNALKLPDPSTPASAVDRQLIRRAFLSYLRNTFASKIAPEETETTPLFGAGRDPTGIRQRRYEMRGLLSDSEVEELLSTGEDPVYALHKKIHRH